MVYEVPIEYSGYPGLSLKLCGSSEEQNFCREYAAKILTTHSYGLKDISQIQLWWGVKQPTYICCYEKRGGPLLGIYRILEDYDILQFSNFTEDFSELSKSKNRVADVGAYINSTREKQTDIFRALFTFCICYLLAKAYDLVYIQVPIRQTSYYSTLGFIIASSPFVPRGWSKPYQAMYMPLNEILANIETSRFQNFWRQRTGTKLNINFWLDIIERIHSSHDWKTISSEKMII